MTINVAMIEPRSRSTIIMDASLDVLLYNTAVNATEEAKKNEQRALEVEKSSLAMKNNLEEELEAKVSFIRLSLNRVDQVTIA